MFSTWIRIQKHFFFCLMMSFALHATRYFYLNRNLLLMIKMNIKQLLFDGWKFEQSTIPPQYISSFSLTPRCWVVDYDSKVWRTSYLLSAFITMNVCNNGRLVKYRKLNSVSVNIKHILETAPRISCFELKRKKNLIDITQFLLLFSHIHLTGLKWLITRLNNRHYQSCVINWFWDLIFNAVCKQ